VVERAFGPAADQFGEAVEPLGREVGESTVQIVRRLLKAVGAVVWAWDRIAEWIVREVSPKLQAIPRANIAPPDLRIVGPAVEAMRFAGDAPEIREMFARLIASDMNRETKASVHPAFVEIIKQMDRTDALTLKTVVNSGAQLLLLLHVHRENDLFDTMDGLITVDIQDVTFDQQRHAINSLERLGLLERVVEYHPSRPELDEYVKRYTESSAFKELEARFPGRIRQQLVGLYLTPIGTNFAKMCVGDT
jgi:hypothetical protein